MKYYFPIHLDGNNRGCEAIAKGTAIILKEDKEKLIGLCTNIELDHRLKVDDYITLQPMRQRSMSFRIKNKMYKTVVHDEWKRKSFIYRYEYSSFLNQMNKEDIMISTGGDMMCYDENQLIIYTNVAYVPFYGDVLSVRKTLPHENSKLLNSSHIYMHVKL